MHIAGRERMIASAGHKTRRTRLTTMLGRSNEDDVGSTAAGREDTIVTSRQDGQHERARGTSSENAGPRQYHEVETGGMRRTHEQHDNKQPNNKQNTLADNEAEQTDE